MAAFWPFWTKKNRKRSITHLCTGGESCVGGAKRLSAAPGSAGLVSAHGRVTNTTETWRVEGSVRRVARHDGWGGVVAVAAEERVVMHRFRAAVCAHKRAALANVGLAEGGRRRVVSVALAMVSWVGDGRVVDHDGEERTKKGRRGEKKE